MNLQQLKSDQVRRLLGDAEGLRAVHAPSDGWLRAIREALGLPIRALAARAGLSSTAALSAERNEARGTISINQLRRMAAALDCELVYALVPRRDLGTVVDEQAEKLAREEVLGVAHSMSIEDQRPVDEFLRKQIDARKRQLLEGSWSRLWR
jgi:predicted DNA-binding mobile mystery protein A